MYDVTFTDQELHCAATLVEAFEQRNPAESMLWQYGTEDNELTLTQYLLRVLGSGSDTVQLDDICVRHLESVVSNFLQVDPDQTMSTVETPAVLSIQGKLTAAVQTQAASQPPAEDDNNLFY
jgi:hypothetical protein